MNAVDIGESSPQKTLSRETANPAMEVPLPAKITDNTALLLEMQDSLKERILPDESHTEGLLWIIKTYESVIEAARPSFKPEEWTLLVSSLQTASIEDDLGQVLMENADLNEARDLGLADADLQRIINALSRLSIPSKASTLDLVRRFWANPGEDAGTVQATIGALLNPKVWKF